ncbi:mitochondrial hypoxia responsive domain-containing protein [Xylariaceae sp. FL0804]|nr:mitochondrial hypoxia responsive domain-containing protein [Xylariaceae sp. FL0804]
MSDRQMPSSFDEDRDFHEKAGQKLWRKLTEEPLIPLGTLVTCSALYYAWKGLKSGDSMQAQKFFRLRVAAQGFTVFAMVAGSIYYGDDRMRRRELVKLEATQKARERHQRWLHELDVRDEEDRLARAEAARKRERAQSRRAVDQTKSLAAPAPAPAPAEKGQEQQQQQQQEEEKTPKKDEEKEKKGVVAAATEALGNKVADNPDKDNKEGRGPLAALAEKGGWLVVNKDEAPEQAGEQKAKPVEEKRAAAEPPAPKR